MFHNTDVFTSFQCCSRSVTSTGCPVGNVYVLGVVAAPPTPMLTDGYYLVANTPTANEAFDGHANEYVRLEGGEYVFCAPTEGDHVTIYGQCAVLCYDNGGFGEFSPAFEGAVAQVGTAGLGVLVGWSGNTLQGRKIVGSGATTVSLHADGHLIINSPTYVPIGQNNDGTNVGVGNGQVYAGMDGVHIKMRTFLAEDSSITITPDGDTIKLKANVPAYQPSQGENIAGGSIPIYSGMSGTNLQFFQLSVDSEWTSIFNVTAESNRVELHYTPSGHSFDIFADTSDLYSSAAAQNNVMMWDSTLLWVNRPITMTNLGTHPGGSAQLYASRSGLTFNWRELIAGSGVTLTQGANTITIAATGGTYTMSNLGAGVGIWNTVVANNFALKSLKGSADIFLSATGTEITITGRNSLAGAGITITPGATDNTFAVTNWSTLLSDAAAGTASLIKSGPPWLLRTLNSGTGITVVQTTNGVTFNHALSQTTSGTGVPMISGWTGADLVHYTAKAGPGMDVQLVGNDVVFTPTSGGSSGAGVSGTALVGMFVNASVTTAMDRWGFVPTTIVFPTTALSVATISKNVANEEFTINKIGKWKISAKVTLTTASSQTQHQMWAEVDTTGGGTWVEIAGSRSMAYTTNEINDLQTIHTGEFSINVTNLTTKIRFRAQNSGGTSLIYLYPGGTMCTFEEAVGPIWEVISEAGPTRTLNIGDNGKVITCTGAVAFTLPNSLLTSFACDIIRQAAGTVSFAAAVGATVQSISGATPSISAQHGRVSITAVSGTGSNSVYNISGNI